MIRRPAAFLDRDGVLIVDDGYPHDPAKVCWMPGAKAAVRRLNQAGYLVFVITNQAGVARGYYTEAAVQHLHDWMAAELAAAGAHVDQFEFCPHHPDATLAAYRCNCRRRKPEPGMILDIMEQWPVDTTASFLIGDKPSDMGAAVAAGMRGYLFELGDLEVTVEEALEKARGSAP